MGAQYIRISNLFARSLCGSHAIETAFQLSTFTPEEEFTMTKGPAQQERSHDNA
jgi:hypothetical protein